MTMKLIKTTAEYSIFQRGDERYAVKDAQKKPVNGEEKVRILLAEGLIKLTAPAAPAEAEAESAEESTEGEAAAETAGGDEAAAEE